jgi:hypothetical protein
MHDQGALRRAGRRTEPGGSSQAGPERSLVTDAEGIPLGVVAAAANRRDDGLLAATLDTLTVVAGLPNSTPLGWCG